MRPARRVLAALLAAIFCLAGFATLPRAARADERSARVHFDEAESLYAQGDFEAALAEYEAAFAAEPLPAFLFNVAQCQRNLERFGDAAASFRRYLALDPDAPNRAAVQKLIGELERKRDRQAQVLRRPPDPPAEAPARQERVALVPVPPATNARPARRADSSPFYTRWWFITGVLVAGAAVTGVVIYDAQRGDGGAGGTTGPGGPEIPGTDFGNTELPR